MDLDASLKSHGSRLGEIESFVGRLKEMMSGADDNVSRASDQLDGLMAFKAEFEAALPDLRKAIADLATVVDDVGKLKADLAPVLVWIAEEQKAVEAAKTAASEAKPADPDKPLEHIAEVEASLGGNAPPAQDGTNERSESERPVG